MKIRKLKIKTVLPILLALFLLGGVSSASAQVINPGEILNNPYFPPADKASYSPVRNILDSSLASSSINELFERYGASMVDYVTIKSRQWENDRISCVEDVQDFIAYVKRGRGDTPPEQWSKLLQPNFFQSRTGPWNDFDGDGLMNSDPTPNRADANGDGDFTDDFDDIYGFGVPNAYSPLVQKFGGNSDIATIMASLGITGIDDDDDNDGIKDVDDPAPFFATFGDARLNGNTTDQQDIYRRIIYSADGQPSFNTKRNIDNPDIDNDGVTDLPSQNNPGGDLNPFGNDFGARYIDTDGAQLLGNTPPGAAGGSGTAVIATGPLVGYAWHTAISSWNSDQALRQIRSFTAQTAYETDEIRKILIDNCVRMADLQGIMGRLEFKELIADRVGREVASERIKEENKKLYNFVNTGYDLNGDGEGDSTQFVPNLGNEIGRKQAESFKTDTKAVQETENSSYDVALAQLSNSYTNGKIFPDSSLTPEQQQLLTQQANINSNALATKQNKTQKTLAGRFFSYLLSATGAAGSSLGLDLGNPVEAGTFWEVFKKVNSVEAPNNDYTGYLYLRRGLNVSTSIEREKTLAEYIANQGFRSHRVCIKHDAEGDCEEYNEVPGSVLGNQTDRALGSSRAQLENTDEISDSSVVEDEPVQ